MHLEKRKATWYAVLTVPADLRPTIGKLRYCQSTKTGDRGMAQTRAAVLVAVWKAELRKARGIAPDPKATFWESLRTDFINAQARGDEAIEFVIEDIAKEAALKIADPEENSKKYHYATNQAGTLLAPLVAEWKASLRLAQKTIDQRHRDVVRMAEHFGSVEALQPQKAKAWSDKLIADGMTASSLQRMMNGCRSLWRYLLDSGTLPMVTPDPFTGALRLAVKRASRTTVERLTFTPDELAGLYQRALQRPDPTLSRLIALGAYTGARIEELCSLRVEHCKHGEFQVVSSKTAAGVRRIPIHPALSELVVAMVKQAEEAKEAEEEKAGYLIPSTAQAKYGVRSDPLSKAFGRLKNAAGFGPGQVFHSIRKTVATQLEQRGTPEGIAADILGHKKRAGMSYSLYSDGSSAEQKAEALALVIYPAPLDRPA